MYLLMRACLLCYPTPRLLRQLMARNVCPWKPMPRDDVISSLKLSLQDIQQAGKVLSLKDTVSYPKARLLKIQPRQYEETLWWVGMDGRSGAENGDTDMDGVRSMQ